MTDRLAQLPLTEAAEGPRIPGISAAELDIMRAAAARFPHGRDTGITIGETRVLRQASGLEAAGMVSAQRDEYVHRQGCHFKAADRIARRPWR